MKHQVGTQMLSTSLVRTNDSLGVEGITIVMLVQVYSTPATIMELHTPEMGSAFASQWNIDNSDEAY